MSIFMCFSLGFMISRLVSQDKFTFSDIMGSIIMGALCAIIVFIFV